MWNIRLLVRQLSIDIFYFIKVGHCGGVYFIYTNDQILSNLCFYVQLPTKCIPARCYTWPGQIPSAHRCSLCRKRRSPHGQPLMDRPAAWQQLQWLVCCQKCRGLNFYKDNAVIYFFLIFLLLLIHSLQHSHCWSVIVSSIQLVIVVNGV